MLAMTLGVKSKFRWAAVCMLVLVCWTAVVPCSVTAELLPLSTLPEDEAGFATALGIVQRGDAEGGLNGIGTFPPGGFKYAGVAYAPNVAKVYAAPLNADAVLVIDPATDATDNTTLRVGPAPLKWAGIAFAPTTEKLYCAPHNAGAVLVIDPVANTTDTDALGGLGVNGGLFVGIAFAPTTGKLYCAPDLTSSVLIIDPATNTTDVSSLGGLGGGRSKWHGIAFSAATGKLYAAPLNSGSVLIINPATNTTDTTAITGLGADGNKFGGIAAAPNSGKLYCAPYSSRFVLVIDPITNATDTATLGDHGTVGGKYFGIAYAPTTGKLYCAPRNIDAVLTIDPLTNATSTVALGPLSPGDNNAWWGVAFAPSVGRLFCAPRNAHSVLTITAAGSFVDAAALEPFRLAAQFQLGAATQRTALSTLQNEMALHSAVLTALDSAGDARRRAVEDQTNLLTTLESTVASTSSTVAALESAAATVCSRPLCGAGTAVADGRCTPDCSDLRRRGVGCEPFCTDPVSTTPRNEGGGAAFPWGLLAGVIVGVAGAIVAGAAVWRAIKGHRRPHGARLAAPSMPHDATMFVNPLHAATVADAHTYESAIAHNPEYGSPAGSSTPDGKGHVVYEEPPIGGGGHGDDAMAAAVVTLDADHYVGPSATAMVEHDYKVFQAPPTAENAYKVFRSIDTGDRYVDPSEADGADATA